MDAETIERKLRAAEMAAGSAILNGADPDEVRRRTEKGIIEALDLNTRRASTRATAPAVSPAEPEGSALTRWAAAVGH